MEREGNLFGRRDAGKGGETVERLLDLPPARIERIASFGQASPTGFWYDQEEGEWVALLEGAATLEWEDGRKMDLGPGDWVYLPPHERHRVARTAPGRPTLWLAVFLQGTLESPAP